MKADTKVKQKRYYSGSKRCKTAMDRDKKRSDKKIKRVCPKHKRNAEDMGTLKKALLKILKEDTNFFDTEIKDLKQLVVKECQKTTPDTTELSDSSFLNLRRGLGLQGTYNISRKYFVVNPGKEIVDYILTSNGFDPISKPKYDKSTPHGMKKYFEEFIQSITEDMKTFNIDIVFV